MRFIAALSIVFVFVGCRTTALIHKKDGTVIEGKIRRSDASTIFVVPSNPSERDIKACRDKDSAKSLCEEVSIELPIARSDIRTIDHPGRTHTIAGILLTLAGGISFPIGIFTAASCDGEYGCDSGEVAITILGFIGIITAIVCTPVWVWGAVTWTSSSSAAAPPKKSRGPRIRPVAMTDGESTYYGLGMIWSW
jgi:hypothetical protein